MIARCSVSVCSRTRAGGVLRQARLLALLDQHHRHIHALLDEGEAALVNPGPARTRSLAVVRWHLMRSLRAYQLFKHAEVFAPIIRGDDPEKARLAEAMKGRCIGIGVTYTAHVGKWSTGGVDSDWSSYEADATAMLRSLRTHLARERVEATKLLGAPGRSPPPVGGGRP